MGKATQSKIVSMFRKQAGLTLPETLLVLGVAAAVAVIAYGGYRVANSDVNASAVAQDTVGTIGKIKQIWGPSGNNYTTLTPANMNKAGVIIGSFKWDGTNVMDGLGNTITFDGTTLKFAMLLGPYSSEDCAKIAPGLTTVAYNINVGAAAALTGSNAGTIAATGSAYKAGTTVNQQNLLTGCGTTNPMIAIEVH